jgi:hypothetical protein
MIANMNSAARYLMVDVNSMSEEVSGVMRGSIIAARIFTE